MNRPREVDFLVLGAGAAGIAAALTARRRGADVLVLEASTRALHTPNMRMSGGWVMTMDDPPEGAHYLAECAGGLVDTSRLEVWAQRTTELHAWLGNLGVDLNDPGAIRLPEHTHFRGSGGIRIRRASTHMPSPFTEQAGWWAGNDHALGGEALYRGMMTGARREGIQITWERRSESLVRSAEGRVTGVRIQGEDTPIIARYGVLIATGGFGASAQFVADNCAVPDTRFYGNPRNDGSGLRLGVSVGAAVARMNRYVGRGSFSYDVDGERLGFMADFAGGGYVVCDQQGLRYSDESFQAALYHDVHYKMQHFDTVLGTYTRSPSYYIFDRRRMQAGPMTFPERGACGVGLYDWSLDNRIELKRGWIGNGQTPGEAAVAAGADPSAAAAFDKTVEAYNRGCESGSDSFGRGRETQVPLDTAPFYCMPLHVGGPHTTGGIERDARGKILSALDDSPIPGLYGAGELGQPVGLLYPAAGCSLSDAICSGIVAAETATNG